MGLPEMGNVRDDLTGDPRCRSRARSLAVDGAGRRDMLEKGQGRQHGSLEMEARTEVQSAGDGEEDGGAACRRWGWGRGWRHGLPEMGMGKRMAARPAEMGKRMESSLDLSFPSSGNHLS